MKQKTGFWHNISGGAVVEATILFPIMIMIFAGLVLLSMYLPSRAALQRATQYAATAIATVRSDTWLRYDRNGDTMGYRWETDKTNLSNVYVSFAKSALPGVADENVATDIVTQLEKEGMLYPPGTLDVTMQVHNYLIYKEIVITATRTIPMPVDLSFVGFPTEIPITVTSTAIVQNGDEFVRNIDLVKGFATYIDKKYKITSSTAFQKISDAGDKLTQFLGIGGGK